MKKKYFVAFAAIVVVLLYALPLFSRIMYISDYPNMRSFLFDFTNSYLSDPIKKAHNGDISSQLFIANDMYTF